MASLLPQHDGYLPYYLLYAGVSAFIHSAVCYVLRPSVSMKLFSGPRATASTRTSLLAHTYGTKNIYTGLIRTYAAYHITNPQLYDLALWTFVGVLAFCGGQFFVWRTIGPREAVIPFVTAGAGVLWMVMAREGYLD
ncbi:hypothetical protein N0V93_007124 [Gnomoniopsis smithogilvyi]|uniref:Ergosterol biosynthesis protein n=1 Tax=Gnomoniopsis smithogilvyi TaxID=1191159 RepID=A0A9W8YPH0_9PEZI|nr:hypothetical protein N0V93_007124 [Gnomoniopsis smithogilvyi]